MNFKSRKHLSKQYLNTVRILIIALLTILFIAGCSVIPQPPPEPPQDNSESTAEESESVAEDNVVPVSAEVGADDLIAQGEELFQRTAGGIGCQACHGKNAQGDVGPNVLGKSAEAIQIQLDSNEAMQFIILSQQEVEAVAAYLEWLQTQQ